jgi:hypothetical protein
MERIEEIMKAVARSHRDDTTVIVCLFTGATPASCAAMPRSPTPEVGTAVDEGFPAVLANAFEVNPSTHDGAVMVGRTDGRVDYVVTGWSFRLFAEGARTATIEVNRGSAFNSCLAMSTVAGVDCIYLASRNGLEKFQSGTWSAVSFAEMHD